MACGMLGHHQSVKAKYDTSQHSIHTSLHSATAHKEATDLVNVPHVSSGALEPSSQTTLITLLVGRRVISMEYIVSRSNVMYLIHPKTGTRVTGMRTYFEVQEQVFMSIRGLQPQPDSEKS